MVLGNQKNSQLLKQFVRLFINRKQNYIDLIGQMGCTSSDFASENNILICNISAENKQKISDAIENNDLVSMVNIMTEIQAFPNSQVSQSKMGWMLTHLCCRWDAHLCLHFLLRYYFFQNPRGFINLMNAQTSQGYTNLHLCCIWNSSKCFKVLNLFGGMDLTLKDNKLKTAHQQAIQYKSTEIIKVLNQYKEQKIDFSYVFIEKLLQGPLLQPDMELNFQNWEEGLKEIFIFNQEKYDKLQRDDLENLLIMEGKIQEKKNVVEEELSTLLKTKLQKQVDYETKVALMFIFVHIEELERQQYSKKEREKLFELLEKEEKYLQKDIEAKQKQLAGYNKELKKIEKEKLFRVKKKSEVELEVLILKRYEVIFQKNKQYQQTLQKMKLRSSVSSTKSKEKKIAKKTANRNDQKLKDLPQHILKIYEQAKATGIFTDKEFPPENSSIGDSSKSKYLLFTQNTVWLRPKQIFKEQFQLFDGIDPNDIKQGSLGVCYMLATISALALTPKNIQKIFIFHDIQLGFYVLRLFVNGLPTFFVVDDLIPCCKTTKSPFFTQPIGKQIWVLLLEKAWAKLIGSYLSAQSMTPDHMMEDLSGAPAYGWWLTKQNAKTPVEKIKEIVKHCQLGHIVVLTSVQDKKIEGIVNNHAYTLLNVFEYNNRYIFNIRNPWGRFQWNGQFGKNSSLCSEQFKKKVNFQTKDDGIFYISQNELLKAFCFYSISHVKPDYIYSSLKFTSKKGENLFFKFKITQPGEINIRITQIFQRMVNDKNYAYSPMLFEIGKIISEKSMIFVTEGHNRTYFGAKSVHAFQDIFQSLEAGEYFIRIKMLWVLEQKYNTGVLGFYASNPINIEVVSQQQGDRLLKMLLYSFANNSARNKAPHGYYKIATMKGQFLFIAQTQDEGDFKVTFKFVRQKMVNTETEIGRVNEVEMSTTVNKDQYGVCTAKRIEPCQGGTTGAVCITFTKI